MEDKIITYGNVPFADVKVGSIVVLGDYYNRLAVGIVEEKRENKDGTKCVLVRLGFDDSEIVSVIIEEKAPTTCQPMYELLSIVRSYV